MGYLRPEVLHGVKLGDEAQVGLPRFAFVVLEKPESPPADEETRWHKPAAPRDPPLDAAAARRRLVSRVRDSLVSDETGERRAERRRTCSEMKR